ncbi:uncharacterized protein N7496_004096 [Penicillium cataractarum]|uniref:Hydrophobin n=1 Tax=Penicillium cataractarum TaxID=2100454 RepID=A0A9W9VGU4_9EURO|nr:uncharacterized protein N7496_004096 [Penicillium cataractarum]KAJ5381668.1 hypothetical protein N7496_004096 [Penicillium cataractarum]
MKFRFLLTIVSHALLTAALPEPGLHSLKQQCSNFELSCCSDFRSSAEGTQVFETSGSSTNIIGNAVAVLGNAAAGALQELTPISILSGCAPLIGRAEIECVNYIACCVPDENQKGHGQDESKCKILKDTSVQKQGGLIPI